MNRKIDMPSYIGAILSTEVHLAAITEMVKTSNVKLYVNVSAMKKRSYPIVVAFIECIIVTDGRTYHNAFRHWFSPEFWNTMEEIYGIHEVYRK